MTSERLQKARRACGFACLAFAVALTAVYLLSCREPAPAAISYQPTLREVDIAPIRLSTGGTIDPNTADVYELTELPGIGETLAQHTIDERETNGPFFYPEDLMQVKGIGIKKLEGFRELLDLTLEEATP